MKVSSVKTTVSVLRFFLWKITTAIFWQVPENVPGNIREFASFGWPPSHKGKNSQERTNKRRWTFGSDYSLSSLRWEPTVDVFLLSHCAVIRSVVEYASPLFLDLPAFLCCALERMQKRALSIILPGVSYQEALCQSGFAPWKLVRLMSRASISWKELKLATHYFPYVRACWLIMNQNTI